jgi:heme-degrading monooxygenase HmoA
MIAVIFEFWTEGERRQDYFDLAAELRPLLDKADGFLSIERFESVSEPGKFLSLSFWRDEEAVAAWRGVMRHREAQVAGRAGVFRDYRLRVAYVLRDYGMTSGRDQAPADSRAWHEAQAR